MRKRALFKFLDQHPINFNLNPEGKRSTAPSFKYQDDSYHDTCRRLNYEHVACSFPWRKHFRNA